MEVIASFQVDHTDLKPGIYISRQDSFGDTTFTTYDIRMTAPNHEPAVNCAALHTIEHLVATYLRNREGWKQNIIYWDASRATISLSTALIPARRFAN